MTPDGLIITPSHHDPRETMDRLAAAVTARGMTIMARIDHAAGAASVGLALRPTELLIFGNPLVGTKLMQASQTMGIDLPLKALVWQDEVGQSWVAYDDPALLARRHGVNAEPVLHAMTEALAAVAADVGRLSPDGGDDTGHETIGGGGIRPA